MSYSAGGYSYAGDSASVASKYPYYGSTSVDVNIIGSGYGDGIGEVGSTYSSYKSAEYWMGIGGDVVGSYVYYYVSGAGGTM